MIAVTEDIYKHNFPLLPDVAVEVETLLF